MPLFELEVKNRVVKKGFDLINRMNGTQGKWYTENLLYLADSEEEAKSLAIQDINKRKILGITKWRTREYRREVKIQEIKRIA
jgi:hypothetical protein